MLISPTPDLEDNSHCIGLTYGLKFLVNNLENPSKLIIRKPGVLSNSVMNSNDIILNFGSYYGNGASLVANEITEGPIYTSVVGLGGDFEEEKQRETGQCFFILFHYIFKNSRIKK
jgi:hypothetical protein